MTDPGAPESKIVALDCFPIKLPLKKPMKLAGSLVHDASILYLRLRSASGVEGWGEAIADPGNAGETVRGMQAMIEARLKPLVIGQSAFDRISIVRAMAASVFANGGAIGAIDMALLDLVGKLKGIAAVDVLGGAYRTSVKTLSIVGGYDQASVLKDVAELLDAGVDCFKLKVGSGLVRDDVAMVKAVRGAIGDDRFLCVDANMAWDIPAALQFACGAADYGLAYLEQPIAADNYRMALLAAQTPVPISADESIHGLNDVTALRDLKAVAGMSLKSIKLGGPTELTRVATICDGFGLSVGVAMMMETSLSTAAMIHTSCALPQIDWLLNVGVAFLAEDPIGPGGPSMLGTVTCPQGPGLGITVDEGELQRFMLR
ncbi:mandelate racemase/muconate lactonizing enzyme family protein [Undibacter mobilis]|uniref:mandelate racemase/muconate lactonizing enzyme family protein n=1 Tax=Undibacter mobilis TaxID=2292256 RepID=UPI00143DBDA5|nr:enolase C-terminal domain-like protein [Undibacter mobilis]